MIKVKQRAPRTVWSAASATPQEKEVGSLLLGLYDEAACCITSASPRRSRQGPSGADQVEKIEPPGFTGMRRQRPSR